MNIDQSALEEFFGPEMGEMMRRNQKQALEKRKKDLALTEDLRALARSVLDNADGKELLRKLFAHVHARPVYPPPDGQDPGEYAAQRQGQYDMLNMIVLLVHKQE